MTHRVLITITAALWLRFLQSSGQVFFTPVCVVSFYGLNILIWEAKREVQRNHLAHFSPFAFVTPRWKSEPVAPKLAACVFKEPCEEGVFTRTPPHARHTHYRGLRLCGELLRFATPAPLQRMR